MHDIDFRRFEELKFLEGGVSKHVSKFELAMMTFEAGFRPLLGSEGIGVPLTPAVAVGDRVVYIVNLDRSRLYLETLVHSATLFEKGCERIFHNGLHSYYACLLAARHFDQLNALTSLVGLKDTEFRAILNGGDCRAAAVKIVIDADAVVGDGDELAVLPPNAPCSGASGAASETAPWKKPSATYSAIAFVKADDFRIRCLWW